MNDQPTPPDRGGHQALGGSGAKATERVQLIIEAAEQAAAGIISDAEVQAKAFLDEARQRADRIAEQRAREMWGLTDDLIQRAEAVRRQSDELLRALDEARRGVEEALRAGPDLGAPGTAPQAAVPPAVSQSIHEGEPAYFGGAAARRPEEPAPPESYPAAVPSVAPQAQAPPAPPAEPQPQPFAPPPAQPQAPPPQVQQDPHDPLRTAWRPLEPVQSPHQQPAPPPVAPPPAAAPPPGPPAPPPAPGPEAFPSAPPSPLPGPAAPPPAQNEWAPAPAPAPPQPVPMATHPLGGAGGDTPSEGARLLATQMAVAGSSRDEIEGRLQHEFGIRETGPMLDAILGPAH